MSWWRTLEGEEIAGSLIQVSGGGDPTRLWDLPPVGVDRSGASDFVAGLVLDGNDTCVEAAPILKWCVGMRALTLATYFEMYGWHGCRAAEW